MGVGVSWGYHSERPSHKAGKKKTCLGVSHMHCNRDSRHSDFSVPVFYCRRSQYVTRAFHNVHAKLRFSSLITICFGRIILNLLGLDHLGLHQGCITICFGRIILTLLGLDHLGFLRSRSLHSQINTVLLSKIIWGVNRPRGHLPS